jgi:hypothetical protein
MMTPVAKRIEETRVSLLEHAFIAIIFAYAAFCFVTVKTWQAWDWVTSSLSSKRD